MSAPAFRMREHPLDGAMERRTAPERASDNAMGVSAVKRADGTPIGLRAYCEAVTPAWTWDWPHLLYIDLILDRVTSGELKFVILDVPPRHGKTEKVTVRNPAYRLELDPSLRIILAAYNSKTARKFSRKIRRVAQGRIALSKERNAAEDWETETGGGVRAAGVGEGIAGLPGDLILIDDPIKSHEEADSETYRDKVWEWYLEDLYTRLEPGGAIVITMTRRHEDDLVGRILASEDGPNWTVIKFPALAKEDDVLGRQVGEALCPDRYDEKALAKIRKVLGERRFASLYQQEPSPAKGLIFNSEYFRFYTTPDRPIIEKGQAVPTLPVVWHSHLQSWDMSFKDKSDADFVAGHKWSRLGADCYLTGRKHARMDFPATIAAVLDFTRRHPEARLKLVEDKANGPAVISTLRHKISGLVAVEPEGDKVARAWSVTPMLEAGNVWLPHPQIAPWVLGFILECVRFPLGTNDDDVDAMVQALRRLDMQINQGLNEASAQDADAVISEAAQVATQQRW
jgi:predicted phage terminase large subunit-like protein